MTSIRKLRRRILRFGRYAAKTWRNPRHHPYRQDPPRAGARAVVALNRELHRQRPVQLDPRGER